MLNTVELHIAPIYFTEQKGLIWSTAYELKKNEKLYIKKKKC